MADDGIGIPKAYQSAIFDRFFRVPTGDLHPVKGCGLGMAYVLQVVESAFRVNQEWPLPIRPTEAKILLDCAEVLLCHREAELLRRLYEQHNQVL